MKINKYIKFICTLLIFPLFLANNVYAADRYDIPESITITTDSKKIDEVKYENYTISSNRIRITGRDEVVYCLEIDEGYPSGQVFNLSGVPEEKIDNIIASGYPSKTAEELNLSNEDEAYFATQIAVWCSLEGYDVNKITGKNLNVVEAIKTIYTQGLRARDMKMTVNKEYTSPNRSIQQVVVVFKVKPAQEG